MLPPPYLLKREQINGVVVETWSDGYCVQKGVASHSQGADASGIVTFALAFKDTNYNFLSFPKGSSAGTSFVIGTFDATTTSIRVSWDGLARDTEQFYWEASGYIA